MLRAVEEGSDMGLLDCQRRLHAEAEVLFDDVKAVRESVGSAVMHGWMERGSSPRLTSGCPTRKFSKTSYVRSMSAFLLAASWRHP